MASNNSPLIWAFGHSSHLTWYLSAYLAYNRIYYRNKRKKYNGNLNSYTSWLRLIPVASPFLVTQFVLPIYTKGREKKTNPWKHIQTSSSMKIKHKTDISIAFFTFFIIKIAFVVSFIRAVIRLVVADVEPLLEHSLRPGVLQTKKCEFSKQTNRPLNTNRVW